MKIQDLVKEKRKRCFIENDFDLIESCIDDFNEFDNFFPKDNIITGAFIKQDRVIELINECDDIYISTGFIGESLELLEKMCEYSLAYNITGKRIFNLKKEDLIFGLSRISSIVKKAFQNNKLYCYSDNLEEFKEVKFDNI